MIIGGLIYLTEIKADGNEIILLDLWPYIQVFSWYINFFPGYSLLTHPSTKFDFWHVPLFWDESCTASVDKNMQGTSHWMRTWNIRVHHHPLHFRRAVGMRITTRLMLTSCPHPPVSPLACMSMASWFGSRTAQLRPVHPAHFTRTAVQPTAADRPASRQLEIIWNY